MHQLLLLRHAKSSWDNPNVGDHSRPLARRGREAAGAVRDAMLALGLLVPDVVLVSPALRTRQTLEALLPFPDTPLIEVMDKLYAADAQQMLAVLHGVAETVRSLLLIGHNPGLHELAKLLTGSASDPSDAARMVAKFPTAALAEFAVPGPWHALSAGSAKLIRFVCPKDLPLPA